MSRFIRLALLTAALGLWATAATAAPRVETDPNKEYPCTPESGAWVICCHEFRGPDADNLARQMVLQIRQRDNLPAYVFNFSDQQKQQIEKEWSNLGKLNPDGSPRTYPDLFVTAGLNDPRVAYWEPAKWVAKLRAESPSTRVLLKTELGAGHSGPSGRYDAWKEEALVYAFLLDVLGVAKEP